MCGEEYNAEFNVIASLFIEYVGTMACSGLEIVECLKLNIFFSGDFFVFCVWSQAPK